MHTGNGAAAEIVVHAPRGEQGDFRICDDGRVLVFPAKHPKSC